MTFSDLLIEKNYTVYKLSKESGISKTTLFDIESGKSNLLECRGRILLSIAQTLNVTIEYLLSLDKELYYPPYEENLPEFLAEGLKKLKKARKHDDGFYDCYFMDVYSSLNVCEVEKILPKEQVNYLRKKYLWGNEEDEID